MRRSAPRPLALALGGLTERAAPRTPLADVQRAWAAAVGEAIAREARPTAERDGVVTIACRSAVWAHELDLMSSSVAERLNSAVGGVVVRRLRCVATGAEGAW